jgi:hypothetical protein
VFKQRQLNAVNGCGGSHLSALGSQRQEDLEFKASLGYLVKHCLMKKPNLTKLTNKTIRELITQAMEELIRQPGQPRD